MLKKAEPLRPIFHPKRIIIKKLNKVEKNILGKKKKLKVIFNINQKIGPEGFEPPS